MLKGKSTIELFDGITGRKKEEFADENLVTNVFSNMLGFGSRHIAGGINLANILNGMTPLYPTFLRGVLLWDSPIPENPDIVIAPPGVKCVGHAGAAYSGTIPTRGTLNVNETELTENGVRMVWDFGTDKGNGTIKALSLTSILGGNYGWMTDSENGDAFISCISSMSYGPPRTTCAQPYFYIGEFKPGVSTFISCHIPNTMSVLEQSYADPAQINIFDKVGEAGMQSVREEYFSITSDMSFNNFERAWTAEPNGILTHVMVTNGTNVRVRTINLITKTITSNKTFTLNEAVRADSPMAFYKNHLYASALSSSSGISRFNESGQLVETISPQSIASSSLGAFCLLGDYLLTPTPMWNSVQGGSGNSITDGTNTAHFKAHSINPVLRPSVSLKQPIYLITHGKGTDHYSLGNDKHVYYVTPYLATINNLAQQVVKNNLNTMKITYELTQG